jgi:hypothetical protein
MSWSIPTLIEQDIKNGKAQYRTFQTGNGGQSILPVPSNSYVVIFGYDFSPAGGGIDCVGNALTNDGGFTALSVDRLRWFETQQISFYTGTDFYPFIHHVDRKTSGVAFDPGFSSYRTIESIDNKPIARQVYITSTNDVTITHGLILNAIRNTTGAIPVTNRTPLGLTYGGSGQIIQAQTDYGPGATPLQFLQPSPKDFNDFGLGLIPANADGQAFATPDVTNGLIEANNYLATLGFSFPQAAASNYYLNLHYALYTETVPEYRG